MHTLHRLDSYWSRTLHRDTKLMFNTDWYKTHNIATTSWQNSIENKFYWIVYFKCLGVIQGHFQK